MARNPAPAMPLDPIDVVITWVDGASASHQEKRLAYVSDAERGASTANMRFYSGRDLYYCLRSVRKFAPWVRHIYIVTDDQTPLIEVEAAKKSGVHIIDHRIIFAGYEQVLPTFNSLAIESMLWRIPGLSENFIYLNDDFLFARPLTPSHFFQDGRIVLRGRMVSGAPAPNADWIWHIWNAAQIAGGFDSEGAYYYDTHYPKPLKRSVMELQFKLRKDEFERNIQPRFRKNWQFYPLAIHDTFCMKYGMAIMNPGGMVEIPARLRERRLRRLIADLWNNKTLFGCLVNSMQIERDHPQVIQSLYAPLADPLPFELPPNPPAPATAL